MAVISRARIWRLTGTVACLVIIAALVCRLVEIPLWPAGNFSGPTIEVLSPKPDTILTASTTEVAGRIERGMGDEVELLVNGVWTDRIEIGALPGGVQDFRFQSVPLRPGNNLIEVSLRGRFDRNLHDKALIRVRVEPETISPPVLLSVPSVTNQHSVFITGIAEPNTTVTLQVDGQATDRSNFVSQDGHFRLRLTLPRAGTYSVTAEAEKWDPSGRRSLASTAPLKITYDPAAPAPKEPALRRELNLNLSYLQLEGEAVATLPRDGPYGTLVESLTKKKFDGRLDTAALMDDDRNPLSLARLIFGDVQINGRLLWGIFFNGRQTISLTTETITVRMRSDSRLSANLFLLPLLSGEMEITRDDEFPLDDPAYILTLEIQDYTPTAFSPQPVRFENSTAVWKGGMRDVNLRQPLHVSLEYDAARNPATWPRLLRALPQGLPASLMFLFAGIAGFIGVIPFLWWIEIIHRPAAIDGAGDFRRRLHVIGRRLLTFALIVPVFIGINTIVNATMAWMGPDFFSRMALPVFDGRMDQVLSLMVVASIAAAGLLLLLFIVRNRSLRTFLIRQFLLSTGTSVLALLGLGALQIGLSIVLPQPSRWLNLIMTVIAMTPVTILLAELVVLVTAALDLGRKPVFTRVIVTTASLLLVYPQFRLPWGTVTSPYLLYSFVGAISIAQPLIQAVLLASIVFLLRRMPDNTSRHQGLVTSIATLAFATYSIGVESQIFFLPITFLLALWIFPRFALAAPLGREAVDAVVPEIIGKRKELAEGAMAFSDAQEFVDAVAKADKKAISPTEFEQRRATAEARLSKQRERNTLTGGLTAQEVVLTVGPDPNPWRNALLAVKYGAVLALPLLGVYLVSLFGGGSFRSSYVVLQVGGALLNFAMQWFVAAFFFGYFFQYLRGSSGLTKGVRMALTIIVCTLPIRLATEPTLTGLVALLLGLGQTFLFFTLLGLWAFDFRTLRATMREQFRWRMLLSLSDTRGITVSASVMLTSVALTAASALLGKLPAILLILVQTVTPGQDKSSASDKIKAELTGQKPRQEGAATPSDSTPR